jgi:hypothetical protein
MPDVRQKRWDVYLTTYDNGSWAMHPLGPIWVHDYLSMSAAHKLAAERYKQRIDDICVAPPPVTLPYEDKFRVVQMMEVT